MSGASGHQLPSPLMSSRGVAWAFFWLAIRLLQWGNGTPMEESPLRDHLRRFKAEVFQALAHPTRIAIVEVLRDEASVPVSHIYERLGLEQANVSQHLAVLRSRQIVVGRKDGSQVFYSLRDPILGKVLDLMQEYFHSHANEVLKLLNDITSETAPKQEPGVY